MTVACIVIQILPSTLPKLNAQNGLSKIAGKNVVEVQYRTFVEYASQPTQRILIEKVIDMNTNSPFFPVIYVIENTMHKKLDEQSVQNSHIYPFNISSLKRDKEWKKYWRVPIDGKLWTNS